MGARLLVGDVFDVMATLPDGCVDLVLTSPPFLALRSYLPDDHPDKAKEIGTEPDPPAFIDTLGRLTAEWRRLLAPHGSIAVELGDTYSGSGGGGGDYLPGGLRDGQPGFGGSAERQRDGNAAHWRAKNRSKAAWPEAKCLTMVPQLYAVSLAYGLNPLTKEPTPSGRWRVRNVVRWCRPNPTVGELGDKFRPATSEMVIACTAKDRYFDLDAVREPQPGEPAMSNPAGAPPLDWWEVATQPYSGAHYATWPKRLLTRPIAAMVPRRVCRTCGQPSRRIVESQRTLDGEPAELPPISSTERASGEPTGIAHRRYGTERTEIGWTDCGHDDWRPGVVLDPFAGSGTTLAVAVGHGVDAIGIDLDERNVDLARERVGALFFEYEVVGAKH